MTGTDLATNSNPDVPTLIELIDRGSPLGGGSSVAFAGADFVAMRAAAVALETEYAIARAELGTKAEEYLLVHRELQNLADLFDLESGEADEYAKKMHASDDVIAHLASHGIRDVSLEFQERFADALQRVASRPPRHISPKRPQVVQVAITAPLGELQA